MPKVSVIVPICNVEKYLEQCIRSAMGQTMHDIEIICMDDGSTDSSSDILDNLAKEDARIRVVHKENTGYGHTMNLGIDMAQGQYIIFLESDDYILPNMCQRLYDVCEKFDLEIVKTDFYKFYEYEENTYKQRIQASVHDIYCEVLERNRLKELAKEIFTAEMYTWCCMYRKEFLQRHCIRHNETPGASFQDNGFWFQTMMYCERLYFLDEAFYMYRIDNPGSSIHNGRKIHACADEFSFIREKIMEYPGDKSLLLTIAFEEDVGRHSWYFTCVDKEKMYDLALVLQREIQSYMKIGFMDVRKLDREWTKRAFVCCLSPKLFCQKMQEEIDIREKKRNELSKYSNIILYGAGVYAQSVKRYLDNLMMWHKVIMCGVTNPKESEKNFFDIEIQKMENLLAYRKNSIVILCAKKGTDYGEEMRRNLNRWGFEHVLDARHFIRENVWNVD